MQNLAFEMRKKLLNLCVQYEGAVFIGGDLSMTDLLIDCSSDSVGRGLPVMPTEFCEHHKNKRSHYSYNVHEVYKEGTIA